MIEITEKRDKVGVNFGTGTIHFLTRDEAFQLAQALLSTLDEVRQDSGEHLAYIMAGTSPAVIVKEEVNSLDTLKYNARIYAQIHKAVIWAICLDSGPTGILAWPKPNKSRNST